MWIRLVKVILLVVTPASVLLIALSGRVPKHDLNERERLSGPGAYEIDEHAEDDHEAKMLAHALQKKPDHVPVLLRLAKLESESGRTEAAVQRLHDALNHDPRNLEVKLELGKLLFEMGDVQGAIRQNQEILEEQPAFSDALYNLGAIYGNLGNKELALMYWEQLLAADPYSESGRRAQRMADLIRNDLR